MNSAEPNEPDDQADVSKTVVITKDRRQFGRLPPQFEFVFVHPKAGNKVAAKVENVSLGGIGLLLESRDGIDVDDEVEIAYRYAAFPAVVRYVETRVDGSVAAGLEWKSPLADPE